MAIGTPYAIGHASGTPFTMLNIPVTAATAAGDAIIAGASVNSLINTVTSVTDTKGNTYASVIAQTSGNDAAVFVSLNSAALTTSDTITVTYSGAGPLAKNAAAIGCSGILAALAADIAVKANGTSAAPSAASGSLAQSAELLVAWQDNGSAGGAITWGAGWTAVIPSFRVGTSNYSSVAARVVSSVTSVTASGTITSAPWEILLVSLKGASATSAVLAASGSVAAAGTVTLQESGSLTAAGSLTASGGPAGTAGLTASGGVTAVAATSPVASLAGASSLTATAANLGGSVALVPGEGFVTASATQGAISSLAASGSVSALATTQATATLAATSTAAGAAYVAGTAALGGTGTLAGSGVSTTALTLAAQGTLTALATLYGRASLAGTGGIGAAEGTPGVAVLAGASTLTAAGQPQTPAVLAATGTLTASGTVTAHYLRSIARATDKLNRTGGTIGP